MFDVETADPRIAAKDTAEQARQAGGLESIFGTEFWADDELQEFVDLLHANLAGLRMKIERIDCSPSTSRKLGFEGQIGVGLYTPAPGYTIPVIIDAHPAKAIKITIRSTAEHRVVRWH
ncbi:MAG TPA: hypothetical protein VGV37_29740 [Aliidongia sp.]|uniref:hypothetical protein n=1 Tax=Aliidongia sp. TaxID=1914230 RepID=UPI002DDCAA34|nr:hypothetical protein [Aliidongia sp.]HEV2678747.1 hypothetical protein [Aliidongia sp.]